jgi:hypothetical protein
MVAIAAEGLAKRCGEVRAVTELPRSKGGQVRLSTNRTRLSVVIPQKILTPIIPQISPDRMDMIRVVLGVVMLDKETGAMDPVVVGPFPLPRPCSMREYVFHFEPLLFCIVRVQVSFQRNVIIFGNAADLDHLFNS